MKAFAFSALLAGTVAALVVAGGRVDASRVEATELQNNKAPAFSLKTADGKTHSLASLMEGADEVHLYFIGHTCPVNARALPYVNKIANTANGKKVKFVGITDADAAGHKAWQSKFDAKYPVLLDTDKKVITSYGAQRSPWFIVVDKKGNISHTDKGYSQASLKMMNEHIAKVNGTKPVDVDLSGAPKNMTYG